MGIAELAGVVYYCTSILNLALCCKQFLLYLKRKHTSVPGEANIFLAPNLSRNVSCEL